MVIRLKWRLFLNWKIVILLLSLTVISCTKITQTEPKYSGNFTTEHIRELWQMCSVAHQQVKVNPVVYYQQCDCAVDTMRQNYDNATVFKDMKKPESEELAVIVRLNCNEYKLRKDNENETSQKDSL